MSIWRRQSDDNRQFGERGVLGVLGVKGMFSLAGRIRSSDQCCELCDAEQPDVVCRACVQGLPLIDAASACPSCAQPSAGAHRCGACLAHPPSTSAVTACFDYRFPLDRLVQSFKFSANLGLVGFFADGMVRAVQLRAARIEYGDHGDAVLVPVPLAPKRLAERGFNQSALLAAAVGRSLNIPVAHDRLRRIRETPPQSGLDGAARRRNLRGAFACDQPFHGERVILVDDVMTTGTTIAEAAEVLHASGAADVSALVVARAIQGGAS
jgi:ComF family protein